MEIELQTGIRKEGSLWMTQVVWRIRASEDSLQTPPADLQAPVHLQVANTDYRGFCEWSILRSLRLQAYLCEPMGWQSAEEMKMVPLNLSFSAEF